MTFYESFQGTLAGSDAEGPDPTRLFGLIEFARNRIEQGKPQDVGLHIANLQRQVKAAHEARLRDYDELSEGYDEELLALLDENFEAYRRVEESLVAALEVFGTFERQRMSAALDGLESAAESLQASTEELAELYSCGALICFHCGMPGKSLQCATCEIDCFYPDLTGTEVPSGKPRLPEAYHLIFEMYSGILSGQAGIEDLFEALDPVEEALLKAEDMVELVTKGQPDDQRAAIIAEVIDGCLEGIAQMRVVEETRRIQDLNEGWSDLVSSSLELNALLPDLNLGIVA